MKTKKKLISYNQNQLKIISDNICENIEQVLSKLNISDYRICSRMVGMSCPVHGGDNNSALNLYYTGDSYRGNWKCRTHQCEKVFKGSVIGLIRGILSHQKYGWSKDGDQTVSFQETMLVVEKLLGQDSLNIEVSDNSSIEKQKFSNTIKYLSKKSSDNTNKVDRSFVRKTLDIPSKYFVSRGYLSDTLSFFDVGECTNPNKEMYSRAVVPIYDIDNKYVVGCTGRIVFDKCTKCDLYHDPNNRCPDKHIPKWKHSSGFRSEENLYNIWNAKKSIQENHTVIIVESPGNVWRLHEAGISNAVAIFGSSFSDKQKMILDISGAMKIITMMDNDEAGDKAAQSVEKKCHKTYIVKHIKLGDFEDTKDFSDIGDMTPQQIETIIKPKLGEL